MARDRLLKDRRKGAHAPYGRYWFSNFNSALKIHYKDDAFRIWKLLVTIDKSIPPWRASFQRRIVARRVQLWTLVFVFSKPWTTFLKLAKKTKSSLRFAYFLWPILEEIQKKGERCLIESARLAFVLIVPLFSNSWWAKCYALCGVNAD